MLLKSVMLVFTSINTKTNMSININIELQNRQLCCFIHWLRFIYDGAVHRNPVVQTFTGTFLFSQKACLASGFKQAVKSCGSYLPRALAHQSRPLNEAMRF